MSPMKVTLLRDSWRNIGPFADGFAQMFYDKLFELSPEIERLFRFADMSAQHRNVLVALNLLVDNAPNLNALTPTLAALGRRHACYGVEERHYEVVGRALVWALQRQLGARFDDSARAVWVELYQQVACVMKESAKAREQILAG